MSTTSSKPPTPSPYALRLYAFLESEWKRLGTNPTRWSRQSDIPDPTVYRWKTGVEPDMKSLRRIAEGLGRPLVDVLVAAGYMTSEEAGGHVVATLDYDVAEAIERDQSISEPCRVALRQVYLVFGTSNVERLGLDGPASTAVAHRGKTAAGVVFQPGS